MLGTRADSGGCSLDWGLGIQERFRLWGCRVQGLGRLSPTVPYSPEVYLCIGPSRVQGFAFGVQGFGFRVQGLGFRVYLGFRV